MKRARRSLTLAVSCFLLLGFSAAYAEVAAKLDRDGDYLTTVVVPSHGGAWSEIRRHKASARVVLNPLGDERGDLPPMIKESVEAPYHPWVVWSRPDRGSSYRLVFTRFKDGGWEDIQWVEPNAGPETQLDADLDFNAAGRPFLVWQSLDGNQSEILLSVWLSSRWSAPIRVSPEGLRSWNASIEAVSNWSVAVKYQTSQGSSVDVLVFDFPVTITDDINPQALISSHARKVSIP